MFTYNKEQITPESISAFDLAAKGLNDKNNKTRENIIGAINGYLKMIEGKDLTDFRYYHNGIINGKFV